MKTLAIATILLASFAQAEEKKDTSGYQTVDMKQYEQHQAKTEKKSGVAFSMNCKTEDGREIKSTDAGFNDCLLKAQNKANQK